MALDKITDRAKKLAELRAKKDDLNASLKEINDQMHAIENEMIQDLMHAGLNRIDVDGIGCFYIQVRNFYKVTDRDAFVEHLHQNGDEDILSVNYNTLNAYMKDWKEKNGELEVPGIDFSSKAQIRMRKK